VHHEERRKAGGSTGHSAQAPENKWQLGHPSGMKLLEMLEDLGLQSLQEHAIGPLDLSIHL
jgi:hypothetical protein